MNPSTRWPAGYEREWRNGPRRYLHARPIYEKDWPKLLMAMQESGLMGIISPGGIIWYAGGYEVKPSSVRNVWGLSSNQLTRLNNYIYVHDPFPVGLEDE
mgnify:CR=1 FL=1